MADDNVTMTDADLCELVINYLIDSTPDPPTIGAVSAQQPEARAAYAEDVKAWMSRLFKRQNAARDLMIALDLKPSYVSKSLGELLEYLPSKDED